MVLIWAEQAGVDINPPKGISIWSIPLANANLIILKIASIL